MDQKWGNHLVDFIFNDLPDNLQDEPKPVRNTS